MISNLRHLLIQRAARLQDRPALSAPEWGTLNYFQLRNRVEGVALGLMALPLPEAGLFSATQTPWDWVCELAVACSGLQWSPAGLLIEPSVLGGVRFNDENGRQPYHEREEGIDEATLFLGSLSQGEWLRRLKRLNVKLGWDHTTLVEMPTEAFQTEEGRGALWSGLFAGAHVQWIPSNARLEKAWDDAIFRDLFLE